MAAQPTDSPPPGKVAVAYRNYNQAGSYGMSTGLTTSQYTDVLVEETERGTLVLTFSSGRITFAPGVWCWYRQTW